VLRPEGEGNWAKSSFEDLVQYNDDFRANLIGTPQQIAKRFVELKSVGVDLVLAGFLHFIEQVDISASASCRSRANSNASSSWRQPDHEQRNAADACGPAVASCFATRACARVSEMRQRPFANGARSTADGLLAREPVSRRWRPLPTPADAYLGLLHLPRKTDLKGATA
jgi:hypothetical protein